MRRYIQRSDEPLLHSSSFLCGELLQNEDKRYDLSDDVVGYQYQCKDIQIFLEMFIDKQFEKGATLMVEGVHLDPSFLHKMLRKYGEKCMCFDISVQDVQKHTKRLHTRFNMFTVDP